MGETDKNKQIMSQAATQLQDEYGKKGFEPRNIRSDTAGIKVAKYLTELPSREVLQRQIQKSLEVAKARFENYIEYDKELGGE